MKRTRIESVAVAAWPNLLLAFHKAARGKRRRADVAAFEYDLDARLNRLGADIRADRLPHGRYRAFWVHDPKKRLIHAACFEDRVFHHALMNHAGPVLERTMSATSHACRPGKGIHRAVARARRNLRAWPWYVKIDIAGYFAAIDHEILHSLLMRRFKGRYLDEQFRRILQTYATSTGKGLPIGSLTSQYFANYYLDGCDRLLTANASVCASIRYMDDIIWWCASREDARHTLDEVRGWLDGERGLTVKPGAQIQPSRHGVSWCGYRILPGAIRLSRRKKRRYQRLRQQWEQCYLRGGIDALELQRAHAAVQAITAHTDCLAWRKENLRRHPPLEV